MKFRVYYDFVCGGRVDIEAQTDREAQDIFFKHLEEGKIDELPLRESSERSDYQVWDVELIGGDTNENL